MPSLGIGLGLTVGRRAAAPPVASFTGTPLSGDAPLSVTFTNTSTNATSYSWEKNAGGGWGDFDGTPTAENPTETFISGTWSVRLTVTGPGGSDTLTRTDYVASAAPALTGTLTLIPFASARAQGNLWQNTAETTPAVADGDRIRVVVDPATGLRWTAPSDAASPTLWDWGGGVWSAYYDGVDDRLNCSDASLTFTTGTLLASVQPESVSGSPTIYGGVKNAMYAAIDSGPWGIYIVPASLSGSVLSTSAFSRLIAVVRAANDVDIVTNGTSVTRTAGSSWPTRGGNTIGADPTNVLFYPGHVLAIGLATDTAPNVSAINTWLASLD